MTSLHTIFFSLIQNLQGFSIAQMAHALLLSRNQTEEDPSILHKTVPFLHASTRMQFPVGFGDRQKPPSNASQPEDLCPSLKECLLYQACVFNFGNEFCLQDPLPGKRKNMDLNITCIKVETISCHSC